MALAKLTGSPPKDAALPPAHQLEDEIRRLKKDRKAVLLAHYYQESEIQDLADFVGDSLQLSRRRRRPTPRSSASPACTSWPRRPRS